MIYVTDMDWMICLGFPSATFLAYLKTCPTDINLHKSEQKIGLLKRHKLVDSEVTKSQDI